MQAGFYEDERWCPRCRTYVWYIEGPVGAFCNSCGHRVHLFRPQDWRALLGRKWRAHALHETPGPTTGTGGGAGDGREAGVR